MSSQRNHAAGHLDASLWDVCSISRLAGEPLYGDTGVLYTLSHCRLLSLVGGCIAILLVPCKLA